MAVRKEHRYTYEEWRELDLGENTRSELIGGQIYLMSAPATRHQVVLGEMFRQLSNYLRGKRCKPYLGLDVRLEDDTVVVPDLVVVCDPQKIYKAGCTGAPDLVVEILSPSTARHDKYVKFMLYLQAGVPEYWVVDPVDNAITAFRLDENKYTATVFTSTATINALPGFEMDLAEVFAEEDLQDI